MYVLKAQLDWLLRQGDISVASENVNPSKWLKDALNLVNANTHITTTSSYDGHHLAASLTVRFTFIY